MRTYRRKLSGPCFTCYPCNTNDECPFDKQKPIFFGQTAILGSFSSKIRLCYVLSLISKEQRDHLNTMREIRNHFAHTIGPASFDDSLVASACETPWPDDTYLTVLYKYLSRPRAKFMARWRLFSREFPAAFKELVRKHQYLAKTTTDDMASYIRST
jgi:hypothetical protein